MAFFSPSINLAFIYIEATKPEQGAIFANLFPTQIMNDTYSFTTAVAYQALMSTIYLLAYLYADQVIPNEYGVAKHPLFFLDYFKK